MLNLVCSISLQLLSTRRGIERKEATTDVSGIVRELPACFPEGMPEEFVFTLTHPVPPTEEEERDRKRLMAHFEDVARERRAARTAAPPPS